MGLLYQCPQSAAPSDITLDCPEGMGQIQKILLQRADNSFVIATANPNVLASWTPLLAAVDGTKVVQSPYLNAPAFEPGAARTFGGGNETVGGLVKILGAEPTNVTTMLHDAKSITVKEMKTYMGEVNAAVYLVDEFGRIWGQVDDLTTPTTFAPIPVYTFFVSDKQAGGIDQPDMNTVSWSFAPNWSDNLQPITPTDFNAKTDLVTP